MNDRCGGEKTVSDLGASLVLWFDGSIRYGPDNAAPQWAAIGYVIEEAKPLVEGSQELSTFVSNTHVELRALLAGVQAITELREHRRVSGVHVRGDAAAVIDTVDPARETTVDDGIFRQRTERIHEMLALVPQTTYRCVSRHRNERAHELATRAYGTIDDG